MKKSKMLILFHIVRLSVFVLFLGHAITDASYVLPRSWISISRPSRRTPLNCAAIPAPDATINDLQRTETNDDIDKVIDQISGVQSGDIIDPYKPNGSWLWRQWRGTVIEHGWCKVFVNMCFTIVVSLLLRRMTMGSWGAIPLLPPEKLSLHNLDGQSMINDAMVARIIAFDKCWHYLLTLTTFILTFFVGQAYGKWREAYGACRSIQGKMADISLLLSTHASRTDYVDVVKNIDTTANSETIDISSDRANNHEKMRSEYNAEAKDLLNDVGRHLRAFHVLFWASSTRRFRVLLTDRGLDRMVERGLLTKMQRKTLKGLHDLPPSQFYYACLNWVVIRIRRGRLDGALTLWGGRSIEGGGYGFDQVLLDKMCSLRAACANVGYIASGRMPMAYAHFVQILVDSFLLTAPLALYAELGSLSIPSVGMLTLFYSGLLDLAKVLLDPFDKEDYCDGSSANMDLAVLIRESNGASVRWAHGAETLPF